MTARLSRPAILLMLGTLLTACFLASLLNGTVAIPLDGLLRLPFSHPGNDQEALWQIVISDLRLPRALLAILAGSAMAAAGTLMQSLFRNPLAEPGLTGVTSGAALGSAIVLALGQTGWLIWPSAFSGALLVSVLTWLLGRRSSGQASLLLAGIAINAICAALIGLITTFASDHQLRNLMHWNIGSLGDADWASLRWIAPLTALLLVLSWKEWRALNALLLGEREARHLGFRLPVLRRRIFVYTALLVAPVTAICGTIGFIGLIAPHLARMLLGAEHRWLLPGAMLTGATLLLIADWLARIILPNAELPVGLITSLLGGPFFLWLLAKGKT